MVRLNTDSASHEPWILLQVPVFCPPCTFLFPLWDYEMVRWVRSNVMGGEEKHIQLFQEKSPGLQEALRSQFLHNYFPDFNIVLGCLGSLKGAG